MKAVSFSYCSITNSFSVSIELSTYIPVITKSGDWIVFNSSSKKRAGDKVFNTQQEAFAYAAELELFSARPK